MSAKAGEFEYPKYITPGNTDESGKISFIVKCYKYSSLYKAMIF